MKAIACPQTGHRLSIIILYQDGALKRGEPHAVDHPPSAGLGVGGERRAGCGRKAPEAVWGIELMG